MKKAVALMLTLTLALTLAACASPARELPDPKNLACVLTVADNNPVIERIPEINELTPGSTYTVINCEGDPAVVVSDTVPEYRGNGYTEAMISKRKAEVMSAIRGAALNVTPASNEVDIAAATELAVRSLRANAADGRDNTLAFYGSGISTKGLINMCDVPICDMDIDSSVDSITKALALDMQGIDITMSYLGDTAGEQGRLSGEEKTRLREFYSKLFTALGADSVDFPQDIPTGGGYSFEGTSVSVMKTAESGTGLVVSEVLGTDGILEFSEDAIGFVRDSTELIDPSAAAKTLSDVIAYMKSDSEFQLLICGTTTSYGEAGACLDFSLRRAQRVRELMMAQGIDGGRLHTVGCGYTSMLYVDDVNDPSAAAKNRSVKLVNYSSQKADDIIASIVR